ncbi:hypothetical protein BJ165DRAFT_1440487 [Panaeolus papilionaceus]|nr:hypothetical protein BJ165DRAFT_1440487 [Panaeolus papilionaceus]
MLLGALIVQCYMYYLTFPNDRRITKVLVLCAIISETLQTALVTRYAYRTFASQWGDPSGLAEVGWL